MNAVTPDFIFSSIAPVTGQMNDYRTRINKQGGTTMTLLDEFLNSIQNLSSEQLIRDIEKAREDSKNSYLLDELPE